MKIVKKLLLTQKICSACLTLFLIFVVLFQASYFFSAERETYGSLYELYALYDCSNIIMIVFLLIWIFFGKTSDWIVVLSISFAIIGLILGVSLFIKEWKITGGHYIEFFVPFFLFIVCIVLFYVGRKLEEKMCKLPKN